MLKSLVNLTDSFACEHQDAASETVVGKDAFELPKMVTREVSRSNFFDSSLPHLPMDWRITQLGKKAKQARHRKKSDTTCIVVYVVDVVAEREREKVSKSNTS